MVSFRPELGWCAAVALLLTSCGGSSSETPFPEEPLPDYLLERREKEPEAKPSADPERPAPPANTQLRAPPEQQREPAEGAGGAPNPAASETTATEAD